MSGPFNLNAAPVARGAFLGDYQGLTAAGSTFIPFFAATNCRTTCWRNPTDIYAARLTARTGADSPLGTAWGVVAAVPPPGRNGIAR